MANEEYEPLIIGFCCNWCSYAGADLAGVSRLQYPPNMRIVRVMCSGMVHPNLVIDALTKGADAVIICGCHIGDCHYLNANHWTERRVKRMQKKMEKMGLRDERLQLEWISAAEGLRFKEVMEKMERLRQSITEQEVAETKRILKGRSA